MENKIQEFYNPIYEEVITVRSNIRVPSKTRRKTQHYKKATNELTEQFKEHRNGRRLYSGKLLITIQICGSEKYLDTVDVDNLVKYILDVLTGILFNDDKQVVLLVADKTYASNGFIIGIRELEENTRPMFPYLPLVSVGQDIWYEIRKKMILAQSAHYQSRERKKLS